LLYEKVQAGAELAKKLELSLRAERMNDERLQAKGIDSVSANSSSSSGSSSASGSSLLEEQMKEAYKTLWPEVTQWLDGYVKGVETEVAKIEKERKELIIAATTFETNTHSQGGSQDGFQNSEEKSEKPTAAAEQAEKQAEDLYSTADWDDASDDACDDEEKQNEQEQEKPEVTSLPAQSPNNFTAATATAAAATATSIASPSRYFATTATQATRDVTPTSLTSPIGVDKNLNMSNVSSVSEMGKGASPAFTRQLLELRELEGKLIQQRQEYDDKFLNLCRHSEKEFGVNLLAQEQPVVAAPTADVDISTSSSSAAAAVSFASEVEINHQSLGRQPFVLPPHLIDESAPQMSPTEKRIFRQLQERGYGMGEKQAGNGIGGHYYSKKTNRPKSAKSRKKTSNNYNNNCNISSISGSGENNSNSLLPAVEWQEGGISSSVSSSRAKRGKGKTGRGREAAEEWLKSNLQQSWNKRDGKTSARKQRMQTRHRLSGGNRADDYNDPQGIEVGAPEGPADTYLWNPRDTPIGGRRNSPFIS